MTESKFWLNSEGNHPKKGMIISKADVLEKKFVPADSKIDLAIVLRFLTSVSAEIWND